MSRLILNYVILAYLVACVPAQVAPTISMEKSAFNSKTWRVAVVDLNYQSEGEGDINGTHYVTAGENGGNVIAGLLASELLVLKNIRIIEREKISHILDEHALQQSGLINAESAIKIGELAGADAVVLGDVSDYVYWENTGVTGTTVSFSMRMIDVESGNVILNGSISRIRTLVDIFPNAQLTTKELVEAISKS
jgi:curli biogenesis system outer membrane secretion channel CsgG